MLSRSPFPLGQVFLVECSTLLVLSRVDGREMGRWGEDMSLQGDNNEGSRGSVHGLSPCTLNPLGAGCEAACVAITPYGELVVGVCARVRAPGSSAGGRVLLLV